MANLEKHTLEKSRVEDVTGDEDRSDKISNTTDPIRNKNTSLPRNVCEGGIKIGAYRVDGGALELSIRVRVPETFIIIFDRQSQSLMRFGSRSQTMTQMQEFNDEMKHSGFTTVSIGDYIYVLMKSKMYRLKYRDPKATWERMADLIGGHGDVPPAVAASGAIIVAGGGSNVKHTKLVTKYDPSQNRWQKLKDQRLSTNYSRCVASKGYVYCLGGIIDNTAVTDRVDRLNIDSQTWDDVAPMREARYWASAVAFDGKLLVAGGWTRHNRQLTSPEKLLTSVEKYEPDVNQWTIMKPMNVERFFNAFRLHLIEAKIYAVGQSDRGIERYDFMKDEWEVVQVPELRKLDIAQSEIAEMMH